MYHKILLLIPALLTGWSGLMAQTPLSWELGGMSSSEIVVHEIEIPPPAQFMKEDERNGWDHRFAGKVPVDEKLFERTERRYWNDRSLVIEKLTVPSDKGFGIKVAVPSLQAGEQIFIYTSSGNILATFDGSRASRSHSTRIVGPDRAGEWYVEYNAPWWMDGPPAMHLSGVYPVYRDEYMPMDRGRDIGFGAAKPCHNNVNCPLGHDWEEQKRGVVRIMIVLEQGIGWCSGSLVNNTSGDGTPFVLSAFHCIDGFDPEFEHWRFDFNYESATCQNPPLEPNFNQLSGCQMKSGRRATDFLLLRLDEEVPADYNAYFNGWDRSRDYLPHNTVLIHHPRADIKKISIDNHPASIFGNEIHWDNSTTSPSYSHYKSKLDDGIFEGGSSGSPLFDPRGRIIGQLHGGNASCASNYAYSGLFARSWDGGSATQRLVDWLDPEQAGVEKLDGMENPASLLMVFSGEVKNPGGEGVRGAAISVQGEIETEAITDAAGFFYVEEVPSMGNYTLSASKTDHVKNGVSALDIVLIRKHILGLEYFEEDYQLVAADLDQSGSVSAVDILEIRKVLLGLKDEFTSPSWMIIPGQIQVEDPQAPEEVFSFTAVKMGDVNLSSDPLQ